MSTRPARGRGDICVVLDANVWRSTRLLKNPESISLIFLLGKLGGKLGVPEIVEREALRHGAALGREARDQVAKGLKVIRDLLGKEQHVTLPNDDEFYEAASLRTRELEHLIVRYPFTIEDALKALDRVDNKVPPAGSQQQFKDSVIWENCVSWAKRYDVYLVSRDTAFYEGKSKHGGLSKSLRAELNSSGLSVVLFDSLSDLLRELGANADASIDLEPIARAVYFMGMHLFSVNAERLLHPLGDVIKMQVEVFATQDTDSFSVRFNATEVTANEPVCATASGQCLYSLAAQSVTRLQLEEVVVRDSGVEPPVERRMAFGNVVTVVNDAARDASFESSVPLQGVDGINSFTFHKAEMYGSDGSYKFS